LEVTAATVGEGNSVLGRPQIDFSVAILAVSVLIVAGLVAGLVPARHAARINPVIALRTE
jgi:putative ABC transport system permease protein